MSYYAAQVRVALLEKKLKYTSRYILLNRNEQLLPGYVKHIHKSGVIPALTHNGTPVTDSRLQILYLDENFNTGTKLVPEDKKEATLEWLRIFDECPVAPLTFAVMNHKKFKKHIHGHKYPPPMPWMIGNMQKKKRAYLVKLIKTQTGELKQFYEEKLAQTDVFVQTTADESKYTGWLDEMDAILDKLEDHLAAHGGKYLMGNEFTAADCIAGPAVFRLDFLGHSRRLWKGMAPAPRARPHVEAYFKAVVKRPSFKTAVRGWNENMVTGMMIPMMGSA